MPVTGSIPRARPVLKALIENLPEEELPTTFSLQMARPNSHDLDMQNTLESLIKQPYR